MSKKLCSKRSKNGNHVSIIIHLILLILTKFLNKKPPNNISESEFVRKLPEYLSDVKGPIKSRGKNYSKKINNLRNNQQTINLGNILQITNSRGHGLLNIDIITQLIDIKNKKKLRQTNKLRQQQNELKRKIKKFGAKRNHPYYNNRY